MTRYRNNRRVTQPCRIVVGSSGVVSFYAPYNEAFLGEFKSVFHPRDRVWNGERKIWQIKPEGIAALVQVMQKYFTKIEGLDALIESPFDTLRITPDAPDELVRLAAKALRSKYHPDKIVNMEIAKELFPVAESVVEARALATEYLQEVGEAEKLILDSRKEEDV